MIEEEAIWADMQQDDVAEDEELSEKGDEAGEQEEMFPFASEAEIIEVVQNLAGIEFVHGMTSIGQSENTNIGTAYGYVIENDERGVQLEGLRIDNCANRASIMRESRY